MFFTEPAFRTQTQNSEMIRPISDHQMYFCVMNENYMKPVIAQKYVEVEVFNVEAIENFKNEI